MDVKILKIPLKEIFVMPVVKESCWECGGSGQSSRGYGDTSPCGTCGETGKIKVYRIRTVVEWFRYLIYQIKRSKP